MATYVNLFPQDLGVVSLMRAVAPNLPVHGSTQMSITSPEGADFAAQLGVDRVVVGRELSISEIAKVGASLHMVSCQPMVVARSALCQLSSHMPCGPTSVGCLYVMHDSIPCHNQVSCVGSYSLQAGS